MKIDDDKLTDYFCIDLDSPKIINDNEEITIFQHLNDHSLKSSLSLCRIASKCRHTYVCLCINTYIIHIIVHFCLSKNGLHTYIHSLYQKGNSIYCIG